MKKIGVLALANKSNGGIYQYTLSMVQALALDSNNKYIIFTLKDNNQFDNLGLEIRKIEIKPKGRLLKLMQLCLLFTGIRTSLLLSRSEKAVFNDIFGFISPIIVEYPHFFLSKPFVVTIHDLQERYFPDFFSLKERTLRNIKNSSIAKHATQLICESNYVKNDLCKFLGVSEKKINVIPAPPPTLYSNSDLSISTKLLSDIKLKYGLPDKYLFYPAQFWYHKNHIRLLEAFHKLVSEFPDIHLVLTGTKKNNYDNVVKMISSLNLHNHVHLLGYLDDDELPAIYRLSQMLVMPTLFESISIPIYEAFSLGVPVCSSNVVGLPEQLGDAGVLFDPFDVSDMAKKIKLLLVDASLRKDCINNGFKKVSGFNHAGYCAQLAEVISCL